MEGWMTGVDWMFWREAVMPAFRITMILLLAWIGARLARSAIRTLRERLTSRLSDREALKRVQTLGRVSRYLVTVLISLIAGMLVLSEVGISVAPILGAAGVVGIAVGFGAQSLVKDYFTGFFLLLENQIRQGDVVQLGDHAGLVEDVTLRYVQLRDYDGNVHFVPNGVITTVVSMSRGFAQAVVDVPVSYAADLHQAMTLMRLVADEMRADPAHAERFTGGFEMAGVERLGDSAIVLRARMQVAPLEQWTVRREYLLRLKLAFDRDGIEIPLPQLVVNTPETTARPAPREPQHAMAGSR
ncbi:MAG: mechanosensitive ion channel family protein [Proteobacteria bacterium]|nr:mechanosensitive ion channel family protein [Burkholderiales bacterium]